MNPPRLDEGSERAIRDALAAMLAAHGDANDGLEGLSVRVTREQVEACRQARAPSIGRSTCRGEGE